MGAVTGFDDGGMAPPGGCTSAEATKRVQAWRRARDEVGRLAPHPAPEVPCRLAGPQDMGRQALALQRAAQAAGWRVQATYARGNGVHGKTGKPTGIVDSIAVRCWGPGGRRIVMCWTRGSSAWSQSLGILWGPDHPLARVTTEVAISWLRDTVGTEHMKISKGSDTVPQKVETEVPLFEAGSGKRAYGKIPWINYADGEIWRFDRETDWPMVKTAGQVVDMAKRFAEREGYALEYKSEADSVWVKFVKKETAPEPAETNPFGSTLESVGV